MRRAGVLLVLLAACGPVGPSHEPYALRESGLAAGGRPTEVTAVPPRFEPGEAVESVVSPGGRFRLHFSRVGPNAVAAADADGSGVPDAVETAARAYDTVAAFYAGLGYLLPPGDGLLPGDTGGDERFDVYLVDFAGRADGAYRLEACLETDTRCAGYMLQENDFAGYKYPSYETAVTILASHEFFHAVQAAYHPGLGSVASEGTAVWASERFDPDLEDLEHFSSAYLSRPDRSLVVDPDGPAQSFSYGASLFFQFLSERLGDDVVRAMWEESVRMPSAPWPTLLDTVLRRERGMDFDTAFSEFATWNLATGARARVGQGYARGAGYADLVTSARTLPVDESAVRVASAATRYFEVASGGDTVSAVYQPTEGTDATALHLVGAAVNEHEVLRVVRADGPGPLSVQVSTSEATRVIVAVVDGRSRGEGRYGRLCVTGSATQTPCPSEEPGEQPPHSEGCQAAPGGGGPWALLLVWAAHLRRTRARGPAVPPGGGRGR